MDALSLPLKGILVEKPLGHTHASGRRILEAVKARRLPMAVPHDLLSIAASLEVIRRVRAGDIGKLKSVEIECDKWDIMNAGIHWMNFFVMLVPDDPVESVMAVCESSTRTYRDGMQVETTAVTCVTTRSGVRAWMVTGDDVKVSAEGKGQLFRIIGANGVIEYTAWENHYAIRDAGHAAPATVSPEGFPVTGHRRHLECMAEMVGNRADYSIPESSLTALAICEAAYLASRHKSRVMFPLENFTPPPAPDWNPGSPYSGSGGGRDGRKL
jgi:predicted dehydrogenase